MFLTDMGIEGGGGGLMVDVVLRLVGFLPLSLVLFLECQVWTYVVVHRAQG